MSHHSGTIYKSLVVAAMMFFPLLAHAQLSGPGSGLVALWNLDDGSGTTAADTSGNGYSGTLVSSPTWTTGTNLSGALLFNGTTQYVNLPIAAASGSSGTISAWIYTANQTTQQAIVTSAGTADTTHELRLGINPTGCASDCILILSNNGGTANNLRGNTALSANTWYHLVVTSDSTTYKLYVNGVLQTITVSTGSNNGLWFGGISGRSNFKIGLLTRSSSVIPFNGKIDAVRIYNRALSAAEVSQLYALDTGPTTYWNLNEGSGTSAGDSSGNGHVGTLVNGPTWISGISATSAVHFDGVDDYIDAGNSAAMIGAGTKTFTMWVKPETTGAGQYLFGEYDGSGGSKGKVVLLNSNGTLQMSWGGSGFTAPYLLTVGTIPFNSWSHLAFVWNTSGSTGSIYLNGSLLFSGSIGTETVGTNKLRFCGRWVTANTGSAVLCKGTIDDVRIYGRALSISEILALYTAGQPSGQAPFSVTAVTSATDCQAVDIAFTPPSSASASYTLYRSTTGTIGSYSMLTGTTTLGNWSGASVAVSLSDMAPLPSTAYFYQVRMTIGGVDSYTSQVSATSAAVSCYKNIGMRVFQGASSPSFPTATLAFTLTPISNTVAMRRGGITYYALLVDVSDPYASRIHIALPNNTIKAFRQCQIASHPNCYRVP